MPVEPVATYRVQLHAGFTLNDAAAIADYLAALGASHLYCSPYLQAAPGSTHGYDVVDHSRVNVELGGEPALDRLDAALRGAGLGQVLDIVPNHMAIHASTNPWWWDVLEDGPSSRFAAYFDVDWDPPEARHENQVLIPILGSQYGQALEAGEIRVEFQGGLGEAKQGRGSKAKAEEDPNPPQTSFVEQALFVVHYFDNAYPVDPRSVSSILARAAELFTALEKDEDGSLQQEEKPRQPAGGAEPDPAETLSYLAAAFERLPDASFPDRASADRRSRDHKVLNTLLGRLCREKPEAAAAVQAAVDELNRDPDTLDVFLSLQNYRLAFWRLASRELGYRRFFDINSLIGLRMEDEQVFADTHRRILEWLQAGRLDGLRVDHPDGLRDPKGYFERLCKETGPEGWIVIEKILEPGERLPEDWPVAGTTGYDFMHRANALFVDPQAEEDLTRFYGEFTGRVSDWEELVRQKKLQVTAEVLGSDVNRLTFLWMQICERHRRYRDYTRDELSLALREAATCLPVYRTYVQAETGLVHDQDVQYIEEAIAAAKSYHPELDPNLFDFLRDLLLLRIPGELESEFVMRFQQFTGPAMAKGVEDTAFYNFYRLVSLNEVGGSPGQFGLPVEAFHAACEAAQSRWSRSLLAGTTHDTKRSEDVRARLNLLSEIPGEWRAAVGRWAALNEKHRTGKAPDRNDEYLIYQTLAGAWPIGGERLERYLEKAMRESKSHTSWTDPDPEYETGVLAFAAAILNDPEFRRDLETFVEPLVEPGRINSLAQTLLRLTCPGIPDIYQGAELWTDSLVDPDNRRPVDYEQRKRLLAGLSEETSPEDVLAEMESGLPKLWLIRQALLLRRQRPESFGPGGSYTRLAASSEQAVAFLRGESVAVVVPRLVMRRAESWAETVISLPEGPWRNVLTGERMSGGEVSLERLLARFPAALLSKVRRA